MGAIREETDTVILRVRLYEEGHQMIPTLDMPRPEMPGESLQMRFRRLADVWHRDTDYLSSMTVSDRHPAYQEIIRLGPDVLPLLLRDLEVNHTHWFAALEAITGARPLSAEVAGNIPKMVDAWLQWAKDHGCQW